MSNGWNTFLWLNCQGQEHAGRLCHCFSPLTVKKGKKVWRKKLVSYKWSLHRKKQGKTFQRQSNDLVIHFISN